jgi:rhomboid protease GluP
MPARFPVLTAVTLTLTAALTATRLDGTAVMLALRRDPAALGSGELWRLLSPVLVQTDRSWFAVVSVFVTCAVIGVIGERVFSRPRWAALYLVGALAGHGIGEVFQPRQGGTSVAFAGVLGGLAAQALQPASRVPRRVQFWAALAIPLAVIDTASEDIHGLPLLAGFGLALFWRWRERADASCHDRAGDVVSRA